MQEEESVTKLLASVMLVNVMMVVVLVYWLNPVDFPGPGDDIAVGAGAYYLAQKSGMLPRVMALLDALVTDIEQVVNDDTE